MVRDDIFRLFILPGIEKEFRIFCNINGHSSEPEYLQHQYVISKLIFHRMFFKKQYVHSGATINRDHLATILGIANTKASRILRNLSAWQMIDKVRGFQPGKYSKAFKLNMRLEDLRVSIREVTGADAYFIGKLIIEKKKRLSSSKFLRSQYDLLRSHVKVNVDGLRYLQKKYDNPFLNKILEIYHAGQNPSIGFNDLFDGIEIDRSDQSFREFMPCMKVKAIFYT